MMLMIINVSAQVISNGFSPDGLILHPYHPSQCCFNPPLKYLEKQQQNQTSILNLIQGGKILIRNPSLYKIYTEAHV